MSDRSSVYSQPETPNFSRPRPKSTSKIRLAPEDDPMHRAPPPPRGNGSVYFAELEARAASDKEWEEKQKKHEEEEKLEKERKEKEKQRKKEQKSKTLLGKTGKLLRSGSTKSTESLATSGPSRSNKPPPRPSPAPELNLPHSTPLPILGNVRKSEGKERALPDLPPQTPTRSSSLPSQNAAKLQESSQDGKKNKGKERALPSIPPQTPTRSSSIPSQNVAKPQESPQDGIKNKGKERALPSRPASRSASISSQTTPKSQQVSPPPAGYKVPNFSFPGLDPENVRTEKVPASVAKEWSKNEAKGFDALITDIPDVPKRGEQPKVKSTRAEGGQPHPGSHPHPGGHTHPGAAPPPAGPSRNQPKDTRDSKPKGNFF